MNAWILKLFSDMYVLISFCISSYFWAVKMLRFSTLREVSDRKLDFIGT